MPNSRTSSSLAHSKALANCAHNYHQWHPTFTLGEKVCMVCGAKAYLHREDVPYTTTEQKPKRTGYAGVPLKLGHRQPVSAEEDVEEAYDDEWPTRQPSSSRRYVQPLSGVQYQAYADHVIPRRQGQANRVQTPHVIYA